MSHTEPAAVGGGDLRATQNPPLWGGWGGWRAGNLEGPHRQPPGKTLVKTDGSPTSPHPPEMGGVALEVQKKALWGRGGAEFVNRPWIAGVELVRAAAWPRASGFLTH